MHEKVLIVEDEILIRFDIADHFRAEQFTVLEAASVQQAKSILDKNPDIVAMFTDVRLSGSENGIDLARFVKVEYPDIKIMITSGHMPNGEIPPEFGRLIDKPYAPEKIVASVKQAVRKRSI